MSAGHQQLQAVTPTLRTCRRCGCLPRMADPRPAGTMWPLCWAESTLSMDASTRRTQPSLVRVVLHDCHIGGGSCISAGCTAHMQTSMLLPTGQP